LAPGDVDSSSDPVGKLSIPRTSAAWDRLQLGPRLTLTIVLQGQDTPGHDLVNSRWEFKKTFDRPPFTAVPNNIIVGTGAGKKAPQPPSISGPAAPSSGKAVQATKPVSGITGPVSNSNTPSPQQRASKALNPGIMVSLTSVLPDHSPVF